MSSAIGSPPARGCGRHGRRRRLRQRGEREPRVAQPPDQQRRYLDNPQVQICLGQAGRDELGGRGEVVQQHDAAVRFGDPLHDGVDAAVHGLPVPVDDMPVLPLGVPPDRAGESGHRPVGHAVGRAEPCRTAQVLANPPGAPGELLRRVLGRPERAVPVGVQPDHVPAVPDHRQRLAMLFDALAQHEEGPRHTLVAKQPRQLRGLGAGAVVEGQRDGTGRKFGRATQQTSNVLVHPRLPGNRDKQSYADYIVSNSLMLAQRIRSA
jgi:hypothetical protein